MRTPVVVAAWLKARWVAFLHWKERTFPRRERIESQPQPRHRFRVERQHMGKVYRAYRGPDGGKARRAWEAYHVSLAEGTFTFYDGETVRGRFTR